VKVKGSSLVKQGSSNMGTFPLGQLLYLTIAPVCVSMCVCVYVYAL